MTDRKMLIDGVLPKVQYGCYFRLVEVEDAEFIWKLRNDETLAQYLNATSGNLEDQVKWLESYKDREALGREFYVMCLSEDKKIKYGVNRLYDIDGEEFEYGSWLFGPDAPPDKAILADLFTHSLAFEVLNLKTNNMSTQKLNKRVLRYTKSFNPTYVGEDELSYYFVYDYPTWNKRRQELLRLLGYK